MGREPGVAALSGRKAPSSQQARPSPAASGSSPMTGQLGCQEVWQVAFIGQGSGEFRARAGGGFGAWGLSGQSQLPGWEAAPSRYCDGPWTVHRIHSRRSMVAPGEEQRTITFSKTERNPDVLSGRPVPRQ